MPALLVVGLLGTVAAVAATSLAGYSELTSSCSLSSLRPLAIGQNSFVHAADGSLLGSIPSVRHREPLPLERMSRWLPAATVAVEDRRFWQHGALDYRAILRAALRDLEHGSIVQGGSTITQQLVRNLYIGNGRHTFRRKLEEACLSLKLARGWSKQQILATYLNQIYYGNHAYGVEAAAQTYFSTDARLLTLPQAALLAGLPQAPSRYDPLHAPAATLRRRNTVLAAMRVAGVLSATQYRAALAAPLGLRPGRIYTEIRHPNFFGYVEDQLVATYGASRVRSGGLQVETTIDPRLQRLATTAIRGVLHRRTDPASALVAIDPRTGAIRAMAVVVPSGRRLQFNLATQGHRLAGSAFKPFVLAAAMTQGISPFSSWNGPSALTIGDPRCATNGQPWEVHNFADESAGTMDLLHAVAHSVNTIFAQLVVDVGPQQVAALARRMGISSPLEPVCSITLGSQPVTPLDLTAAYATLAARGVYHAPQALKLVRSPAQQVLPLPQSAGVRALPRDDADLVTYALQNVIKWGTGTAAAIDRPAAGKTGTAEGFKDAWFCGYVPQLAACVWVGYPHREIPLHDVEGVPDVFGGSLPAGIWQRFMAPALRRSPVLDFPQPSFDGHDVYPPGSFSAPPPSVSSSSTQPTGTGSEPAAKEVPAPAAPPAPAPQQPAATVPARPAAPPAPPLPPAPAATAPEPPAPSAPSPTTATSPAPPPPATTSGEAPPPPNDR